MKVTVKVGGPLRKRVKGLVEGSRVLDLKSGARVTDAIAAMGLELDQVRVIMLGGRPVFKNVELKEGDRLAMFPPEMAFNMYVAINFHNHLLEEGG